MMIQRIGALTDATNTTTVNKPQPQKPSFEGLGVNKTGKTMKALAAAAILGMAAVGMSSCAQPTDPTIYEIPEEKEETTPVVDDEDTTTTTDDEETKPVVDDEDTTTTTDDDDTKPTTGDEETKPTTGDEETKPVEETPFILNDTISQTLAKTETYKVLSEVGFENITGVDVPVEEGKYQPKTGEIVELYYNDLGMYPTTYTLNRELSKDGHLVYDCARYKEIFGLDTMQTWTGEEFICDTKNKTLTHYTPDPDEDPASYKYEYIKINDDGSFVLGGYKNSPNDGSLYEMPVEFNKNESSVDLYMDIAFKLAK